MIVSRMKLIYISLWLAILCLSVSERTSLGQCGQGHTREASPELRPPAVPLVVCDPYFSTWSIHDNLYDGTTTHWTGANHSMTGLLKIDGKNYRFMGFPESGPPSMQQESLDVYATRTVYVFHKDGIRLTVTFMTPALLDDLDIYARPVTYVTFSIESMDGRSHKVEVYVDASAQWAVNEPGQHVVWNQEVIGGPTPLNVLRIGTEAQPILQKKGDNLRIDWGYFYLATTREDDVHTMIASADLARDRFCKAERAPIQSDSRMPRAAGDQMPVMACHWTLDDVAANTAQTRHIVLAYDDLYSIQYFHKNLRPYWKRHGTTMDALLVQSETQYQQLTDACCEFDKRLRKAAQNAGGIHYAKLCELVYRQCLGAHKLVADEDGTPLYFSKECFSNGCMATVDVTYPSSPFFLIHNRTLLKGQLIPIFTYAASDAWPHDFAPHDVGTYPHANGQAYHGTRLEGQMPVEECGNMLIMTAGICTFDSDTDFAATHWERLTQWAEYLRDNGLDPINQLCTADMFGHMAHNADLSLKAIIGLGGYALMAERMGKYDIADTYGSIARDYARQWQVMARDEWWNTRLAFDRPGTWGMKHNLVWDRVLGLNLFPSTLGDGEIRTYYLKSNIYGFPCDNRTQTSLLDWAVWCASLARHPQDFSELTEAFYRYANETPSRVPLSDWFFTTTGKQRGFQARSVVGGIFMRLLAPPLPGSSPIITEELRDKRKEFLTNPHGGTSLLDTAEGAKKTIWRYVTDKPSDRWIHADYDDSTWVQGSSGFGTQGTPAAIIGTTWQTSDIWLRTVFRYDGREFDKAALRIHHDEVTEIFVNGKPLGCVEGWTTYYQNYDITNELKRAVKKGQNTIAVHCHQTTGGQYIDMGIILDPELPLLQSLRCELDLPTIQPLFNHAVRDTSVCIGPDGTYYLTGTTADNPSGSHDETSWWYVNEGIRLWQSNDLKQWKPLGLVWSLEKDATWAKVFKTYGKNKTRARAVWAPEIHYLKGNFWLTYSMNYRGCGLLKSISGKAEGPYVDVKTDGPLTGEIDASLFQDEDGNVYWIIQNGKIALMRDDMTGLAEEPRLLKPANHMQVGFEGAFLTKYKEKYVLICAEVNPGRTYDCMAAVSDNLYGPYSDRYLAIAHAGHNMLFKDLDGRWMSTFFGNSPHAAFREKPGILPIAFDKEGRFRALMRTSRSK